MIDTINLKDRTIEWMGRSRFRPSNKGTLWPSEASVKFTNQYNEEEVVGKCHRAVHYRLSDTKPTDPPTGKSQVVFLLGHQIEAAVTEVWKQMGIWESNSVKWNDKIRNISGEYDVVLRDEHGLYGVEVKSFYGYYANKHILGHHTGRGKNKVWVRGKPKDEHLMQAAIYCDQARGQLHGFKLFYVSRDNCEMIEHNITVDEKKIIYINDTKETRFTVQDIYDRYEQMNNYVITNTKPIKEFVFYPSDARVKVLHDRGDVSVAAYKKHVDNKEKVRDFHCSYCDFKTHCWEVDNEQVAEETVTVQTPEALKHGSL